MNTFVAKPPSEFSTAEIEDFISFVLAGGEVTPNGLREQVTKAECLAFLRRDKCLVGVAGLKNPRSSYRTKVQNSSHIKLSRAAFPFELGWVFILPSARGAKLSLPLCQPVVEAAGSAGVFATSRAGNSGMQTTLKKLGFQHSGAEWKSKQNPENLMLFIRNAA